MCQDFKSELSRYSVEIDRRLTFRVRAAKANKLTDTAETQLVVTAATLDKLVEEVPILVPPGGLGVGLPGGYRRKELLTTPRMMLLGYTLIFLMAAFFYAALMEVAGEQALIIEGKLREKEFGTVSSENDSLEQGLRGEESPISTSFAPVDN